MKPKVDTDNIELAAVLDALLSEDVDITARSVARRHPRLRNASAFTRNLSRMSLIREAQARQNQLRTTLNPHARRVNSLAEELGIARKQLQQLEDHRSALIASHAACIRAVMVAGGMSALEEFWKEYRTVGETLRSVSAFPQAAEVINLSEDR